MLELFLPDVPGLLLEKSYVGDKRLLLFLSSTSPFAICPKCQAASTKIHSHYSRIVADLPWAELAVRFLLRVRRFFCHNSKCKSVTFAERLGSAIPAYARRTQRRTNQLQSIGLALGGEAGARLAKDLGIPSSADTILNLVRTIPLPKREGVRILGIDDWAITMGKPTRSYKQAGLSGTFFFIITTIGFCWFLFLYYHTTVELRTLVVLWPYTLPGITAVGCNFFSPGTSKFSVLMAAIVQIVVGLLFFCYSVINLFTALLLRYSDPAIAYLVAVLIITNTLCGLSFFIGGRLALTGKSET